MGFILIRRELKLSWALHWTVQSGSKGSISMPLIIDYTHTCLVKQVSISISTLPKFSWCNFFLTSLLHDFPNANCNLLKLETDPFSTLDRRHSADLLAANKALTWTITSHEIGLQLRSTSADTRVKIFWWNIIANYAFSSSRLWDLKCLKVT